MKSLLLRINSVIALTLAGCIVIALAIGISYVNRSTYKTVLLTQESSMEQLAEQMVDSLQNYFEEVEALVQGIALQQSAVTALQDPQQASQLSGYLAKLMKVYQDYWAIFAFDMQGDVVAGFNAQGKDMQGADRSGRDYVQAILDGKNTHVTRTILDAKSSPGTLIFGVSAAVKDDSGATIGGIAAFPKWRSFTDETLDPVRVGKEGYGFIIDAKGRILAHAVDKSLLLQDLSAAAFIKQAMKLQNGTLPYEWKGRDKVMSFRDVPETGWIVVMSAYESDLTAAADKQRTILLAGGVVMAVLLVGLLLFILRRVVVRPVQRILAYASTVARGDLGASLHGSYHLEFAELAGSIRHMVAELKEKLSFSEGVLKGITLPCAVVAKDNSVSYVNQSMLDILGKTGAPADYLGTSISEFVWGDASRKTTTQRAMEERRMIQNEIAMPDGRGGENIVLVTSTPFFDMEGQLQGSVALWLDMTEVRRQQREIEEQNQRIATAADEADKIAHNMASAAEELASQIEEASRGADSQRARTAETATAMEEMNASVLEVARNASNAAEGADTARHKATEGAEMVNQAIESINRVQADARKLKQAMEDLGLKAESIGQVINVITDIADQTNLLALNAAIEAARAGEAGRGFAVVADEVRKLAEKTMSATKEVEDAVRGIQHVTRDNIQATENAVTAIDATTETAGQSGQVLREIVELIQATADQVRSIATAAEEQSSASEEINQATDEVNRISSETSQVMLESSKAVQEVASLAQELENVISGMQQD